MLKYIYLRSFFTEFESKFFQNKQVYFSYLFRNYMDKTVDNIQYPVSMKKWNSNMDKASYESYLERHVALIFERIVINCRSDEKY